MMVLIPSLILRFCSSNCCNAKLKHMKDCISQLSLYWLYKDIRSVVNIASIHHWLHYHHHLILATSLLFFYQYIIRISEAITYTWLLVRGEAKLSFLCDPLVKVMKNLLKGIGYLPLNVLVIFVTTLHACMHACMQGVTDTNK